MKRIIFFVALMVLFFGCLELNGSDKGTKEDKETALSAPANVKAVPKNKAIELSWEPITNEKLKGYNIYRTLNPGKDYAKINSYPIKDTTYRDAGLAGGITYYYVVTSMTNSDKESNYSTEVSAIPIIISSEEDEEPAYVELCNKEATRLKIDQCLKDYAVKFNDISACKAMMELSIDNCIKEIAINLKNYDTCKEIKLKNIPARDECFYKIAMDLKDLDGCNQIIEEKKANDCKALVAASESRIEACKKISVVKDRDTCFKAVGVSKNDFVACSYISTARSEKGFERDECLNSVLENVKEEILCTYFLDEKHKNNCYSEVGKDQKNPVICSKSTDQNVSDYCIKYIALEEEDSDYCLQIKQQNVFQECIIEVSEINPEKKACELITDLDEKDNCYYNTATATQKDVYCSFIIENEIRDTCFEALAIDLNNASLCGKIRLLNKPLRNHCYLTIALNSLDSALCEEITGSEQYISCYKDIAVELNDFSVCNSATKFFPKLVYRTADYCLYSFAEDTNNANACSEILNSGYRNECDVNAIS
jgi:hypothetical protein